MDELGFAVPPRSDAALLLMAEAAAEELEIAVFTLDQILWQTE
jgi:hypothetical protein